MTFREIKFKNTSPQFTGRKINKVVNPATTAKEPYEAEQRSTCLAGQAGNLFQHYWSREEVISGISKTTRWMQIGAGINGYFKNTCRKTLKIEANNLLFSMFAAHAEA